MAEWQTRRSQKPLRATSCGFNSRLRHQAQDVSTVGVWLSLVERRVRVAEVGGSNPLTPTSASCIPITWNKTTNPCRVALFLIPDYSMSTIYDHLHYPGSGLKQDRVWGFAPGDLLYLPCSGGQKQGIWQVTPARHPFSARLLSITFNQEG